MVGVRPRAVIITNPPMEASVVMPTEAACSAVMAHAATNAAGAMTSGEAGAMTPSSTTVAAACHRGSRGASRMGRPPWPGSSRWSRRVYCLRR